MTIYIPYTSLHWDDKGGIIRRNSLGSLDSCTTPNPSPAPNGNGYRLQMQVTVPTLGDQHTETNSKYTPTNTTEG